MNHDDSASNDYSVDFDEKEKNRLELINKAQTQRQLALTRHLKEQEEQAIFDKIESQHQQTRAVKHEEI